MSQKGADDWADQMARGGRVQWVTTPFRGATPQAEVLVVRPHGAVNDESLLAMYRFLDSTAAAGVQSYVLDLRECDEITVLGSAMDLEEVGNLPVALLINHDDWPAIYRHAAVLAGLGKTRRLFTEPVRAVAWVARQARLHPPDRAPREPWGPR